MRFLIWKPALVILATAWIVTGCKTTFTNYTPERIPQNPSGIYTFKFAANLPVSTAVAGTEEAFIVINGETHPMTRSEENPRVFYFDYRMPQGVTEARYYFIISYDNNNNGIIRRVTKYSTHQDGKIYHARLINRYPIQLVSDRGPVGASIALVGSGFADQDVVVVGDREAATFVHSAHSMEFSIPSLPAGQRYPVVLRSGGTDVEIGDLRIDPGNFSVQPRRLNIQSGQADLLIFQLSHPAPRGGLSIDIQTDIPASVIMPEVVVPEGAQSVNVRIEGGEPGSGTLYAEIPGFETLRIPVEVY